ncbi:TonB-dependent receptor [Flavisphingomonas formosensis]|uniref:TonB-dependent receptor n=1 Tax=Flavisphingomonas formosensis TaxID=861534 RepID=UPI0012F98D49|nr:TonB-dependent receptor [Sphingomonas formosensis]
MIIARSLSAALACGVAMGALASPAVARASDGTAAAGPSNADASSAKESGEIVVTATKSRYGTSVQNVAATVSAFGAQQIQQSHIETITDFTRMVPNVHLTGGANANQNNYTIRGMGVYTSAPTTTPTVGVFLDGVYIGMSGSTALSNMFDVEGVEVLRGPQGLLFGRNVTAGAILLRTSEPSETFKAKAEVGIESGPRYNAAAMVTGPLSSDGVWSAKVSASVVQDEGWFHNDFNGKKFGKNDTTDLRAALKYHPSSGFATILRLEAGKQNADPTPMHDSGLYGYRDFTLDLDLTGYTDVSWQSATLESRLDVGFGNGQIINIAAFRHATADVGVDEDGTPTTYFNFYSWASQHQWSDELRYSGKFGPVSTTIGAYYYTDRFSYLENRYFGLTASSLFGGGVQKSTTWALFSNFDIDILHNLTLNLGARFSNERKSVKVAAIKALGAGNPCRLETVSCSYFPFADSKSWNAFTPKIGIQWKPTPETNIYAYWTKGFRSGGFNIRQTNPAAPPSPYGQEVESTFEAGIKQQTVDRRGRISLAAFHNKFHGLQRDISFPDPLVGTIQTTANTADATIYGFEGEASFAVVPQLTLSANFGYLHGKIDKLLRALAPNGVITPSQLALQIPYLSPWSYGFSGEFHTKIGGNTLAVRATYFHQDQSFSNDINTTRVYAINNVDADITLTVAGGRLGISAYGKNLLNNVVNGLQFPLAFQPGMIVDSLTEKGRVFGLKARFSY